MTKFEMTRKDALTIAVDFLLDTENEELQTAGEVLNHMIEQLNKSKKKTPEKSAARKLNEAIAFDLFKNAPEVITCGYIVSNYKEVPTSQKAVGVMTAAADLGLFERFKDGKQTAYRKLSQETEE